MSNGYSEDYWNQLFANPDLADYADYFYDIEGLNGMTVDGAPVSWAVDGGTTTDLPVDQLGMSPEESAGAMAEIDAMLAGMQVDQSTGDLYLNGQKVGGAAETQALVNAIGSNGGAGTTVPGAGGAATPDKSWLEGVWAAIPAGLKSALPQAALLLGLGGAGLGISRAVAPGGYTAQIPPPPGPSPQQMQAQAAMTSALTNRPSVPLPGAPPPTGVPGAAPGVPAPSGFPTPDPTGAFGATGQENLESTFRSGLAGQSLAAQLAALQTSRELSTTAEMAPYEDALRMKAITEVPQFMTPPGGSTWTRTVPARGGGAPGAPAGMANMIARLMAARGAPQAGGVPAGGPNLDRAWAAIEAALAGGG